MYDRHTLAQAARHGIRSIEHIHTHAHAHSFPSIPSVLFLASISVVLFSVFDPSSRSIPCVSFVSSAWITRSLFLSSNVAFRISYVLQVGLKLPWRQPSWTHRQSHHNIRNCVLLPKFDVFTRFERREHARSPIGNTFASGEFVFIHALEDASSASFDMCTMPDSTAISTSLSRDFSRFAIEQATS